MHVDVIDDFSSLLKVKEQWQRVYDSDPEKQFFLSWTWISKWLDNVVKPWIVLAALAQDGSGEYVAFLPLRIHVRVRKGGGFYNDIEAACQAMSDCGGLICKPEQELDAIPALAKYLRSIRWANLELRYFSISDRRFNLLLDEFTKREFTVQTPKQSLGKDGIDYGVSLYVDLPESWEAYLAAKLGYKMRRNVRSYLRKVEDGDRFRITVANHDTIERDLDILLNFWALRWHQDYGKNLASVQRADRIMMRHCFEEGVLFMPVFWDGERPLGALAALVDQSRDALLFKLIGRDESFINPSPGIVLFAYCIRHAIEAGLARCDFLQGNHGYKYGFGVDEFRLKHRAIFRRSALKLTDCLDKRWLDHAIAIANRQRDIGRSDEAIKGYRQILKVDPHQVDVRRALADQLVRKGHRAAADRILNSRLGA